MQNMQTLCLNCNSALTGKYCSACGQEAKAEVINWHFVAHDIQHGLLHFDKGLLFTSKQLLIRPGHTIRDYLKGKRVKQFKPISYVIVLAGIYGFLTHYFDVNIVSNNIKVSGESSNLDESKLLVKQLVDWLSAHYTLVTLLQIPIFTLSTFLVFYKSSYNIVEHFILNSYLTGQRLLFHLLLFPIYYLTNNTDHF